MPAATVLVTEFAGKMGFGGEAFSADSPLALCFDGKYVVSFQYDPDDHALILAGGVGTAEAGEAAAPFLLTESCLGANTGGAAFGLSPETGEAFMWKRWSDEFPDLAALEAAISQFLGQLEHWQGRLAEWRPQEDARPAGRDPAAAGQAARIRT
ncbi:MAG: type III secretion system chaperone [Planctomycetota bacterium]|nr:type III secretion system chaperone [Planctomycetota bacterium]